MKLLLSILVVSVASCVAHGQSTSLTDESIAAAIKKGMNEKPAQVGLHLDDVGSHFAAAMDKTGNASLGFDLYLYTPATWIEYQAAEFHHLMKVFKLSDLTEDMQRDVIRIMVHANTPQSVSRNGMRRSSNVDHVVIQDLARKEVVQPSAETQSDEMVASAVSSQFTMHGQVVEFASEDVKKIRGASGEAEFYVTVIGDKQKKDFKVKAKHFSKL
jgi:hypothetical protein